MREIKFRFWNPDKFMMDDHKGWREDIGINEAIEASQNYGYKIMQYTGLKDKNGVEIYEGDIVTDNATTFKIEWYKGRFDFKRIKGCYQQPYFGDNCSRMEIIGDIHQNPELCNQ